MFKRHKLKTPSGSLSAPHLLTPTWVCLISPTDHTEPYGQNNMTDSSGQKNRWNMTCVSVKHALSMTRGDAAGLRYSPRLLVRPESTDFIGCFPLRSLRCQQQKNKIVAIVPSKSSNSSSTHWMLYGRKRTKNAAAIIIRRDVGQIPQPQTAGSCPLLLSPPLSSSPLLPLCRRELRMGIKTLTDTREASHSTPWGAYRPRVDCPQYWYHYCEVQRMTQQRSELYLFIYLSRGQGESADSSEHRSSLLQSAAQKDQAVTLITILLLLWDGVVWRSTA